METKGDRERRRKGEEAIEQPGDQATIPPVEAPTEEPGDKPTGRQKEPKAKVTYSLTVSLIRLVDTVAAELGVESCELVEALLRPALRGCRKPTIPDGLRQLFPPKGKSAA